MANCTNCGAPLEPNSLFCVVCGTKIGAAPAAIPTATPATPQGGGTVLARGAAPTGNGARCPSCGATLEPGAAFCVVCGTGVGATSASAAQATPLPTPSGPITPVSPSAGGAAHTCPSCGAPLEPDADFCVVCGKRVPDTTPQGTELAAEEQDMRTQLVFLTRDEAAKGCQKMVEIDGRQVPVNIPAGTNGGTNLDIPGYGYPNSRTGQRGVLRLNFFVD